MALLNTSFQNRPQVFNWTGVWAIGWSVDCFWDFLCQEILRNPACVFGIVVMLQAPSPPKLLPRFTSKIIFKELSIIRTIHRPPKGMEPDLSFNADGTPHHNSLSVLRNSFHLLSRLFCPTTNRIPKVLERAFV